MYSLYLTICMVWYDEYKESSLILAKHHFSYTISIIVNIITFWINYMEPSDEFETIVLYLEQNIGCFMPAFVCLMNTLLTNCHLITETLKPLQIFLSLYLAITYLYF